MHAPTTGLLCILCLLPKDRSLSLSYKILQHGLGGKTIICDRAKTLTEDMLFCVNDSTNHKGFGFGF